MDALPQLLATLIVAAFGAAQLLKLPIDAVPDITNKQVQINTVAPALGPLDMERLVTFPVETAMAGIPGLESSRSISLWSAVSETSMRRSSRGTRPSGCSSRVSRRCSTSTSWWP